MSKDYDYNYPHKLKLIKCDGPDCMASIKPHAEISKAGWIEFGRVLASGPAPFNCPPPLRPGEVILQEKFTRDFCPDCHSHCDAFCDASTVHGSISLEDLCEEQGGQ